MKNILKKFKGKPLDDEKVAMGMHYCFCNARDLYEDAREYNRDRHLFSFKIGELFKMDYSAIS